MVLGVAAGLALGGCGGGEADESTREEEPRDRLVVTRDDGRGGAFRIDLDCERGDRVFCGRIATVLPELAPSDAEVCTDVVAGLESIRIDGTLGGEPVAAEVNRLDSCSDARYRRLDEVLRP